LRSPPVLVAVFSLEHSDNTRVFAVDIRSSATSRGASLHRGQNEGAAIAQRVTQATALPPRDGRWRVGAPELECGGGEERRRREVAASKRFQEVGGRVCGGMQERARQRFSCAVCKAEGLTQATGGGSEGEIGGEEGRERAWLPRTGMRQGFLGGGGMAAGRREAIGGRSRPEWQQSAEYDGKAAECETGSGFGEARRRGMTTGRRQTKAIGGRERLQEGRCKSSQSMNQGRPNAEKRQIDGSETIRAEERRRGSRRANCPIVQIIYLLSVVFIHLNANSVAFCLPSSSAPQVHVITFVSESNMH